MKKGEYHFEYEVYDSIDDLEAADASLLLEARRITGNSYSPYSNFKVGAAARLSNGNLVTGSNQENASFPVGLCAERVLLGAVASVYPGEAITSLAISYNNLNGQSDQPISPCGICRQSLLEYESRVNQNIRVIMGGLTGKVYIIDKAAMLLPLSFTGDDLKI